jgi:glycerophosphoryl diester phosphodiesterase
MKNIVGTLVVAGLCMSSTAFATQIVGHRGASFDAPENTLSSFKLGYKENADADELDIHLTKDGKVVVMHDYDTGRTGGTKLKISEHTLEELRALDIGKWGKWQGKGFSEKIPLLSEVLELIPDGKRLFIEIKCGPEILPELANVLKKAGKKPEQTVIIGFGYETMKAAKEKFPNLEVNWLVQADKKTKAFPPVEDLIAQSKAAKLDGLDLHQGFPINKQFVEKVHGAGLKLYTWTVDDPAVAKAEAEAGVDGITTNRPGWLREQLAAKP